MRSNRIRVTVSLCLHQSILRNLLPSMLVPPLRMLFGAIDHSARLCAAYDNMVPVKQASCDSVGLEHLTVFRNCIAFAYTIMSRIHIQPGSSV